MDENEAQPIQASNYITEGTWRGMPLWDCTLCAWNTLDSREAAIEHVMTVHLDPPLDVIEERLEEE